MNTVGLEMFFAWVILGWVFILGTKGVSEEGGGVEGETEELDYDGIV